MKILGIDPGTAIVGWGVVQKNEQDKSLKAIAYDSILTDKKLKLPEKICFVV